jgi:NADH-quinone oxidoreductase subunit I
MYGLGMMKGLALTLKHFWESYTEDIRWYGQNKYGTGTFALRQGTEAKGMFTVEYPDEKIAVPERFRFVPFLVVNNYDDPYAPGDDWCTSCGICAKVCPPQCIWIVRGTDPETGRPKPQPEAFYIDIDICMNCGYCAEYCPFDAIKMDHDYELASYDRTTHHIFDKSKLSKEFRYWQTIAPNRVWDEAQDRGHWEHRDVEKLAKKAGVSLPAPSEDNMHRATTVLPSDKPIAKAATAAPALAAPAAAPAAGGSSILAAKELEQKGAAKTIKLTSADRKLISAAKKAVQDAGLDWDNLDASKVASLSVAVPAAAPAEAEAPAVAAVATAPAPAAPSVGLDLLAAKELERAGAAKEIKLTGDQRKQISAAKKAAADAGLDWDNLDASAAASVSVAAPAAPVQATPIVTESAPAPAAAPAPASGDAEIRAAKELENQSKAKTIKLTGEDRKRISMAKKAAADAGIDWEAL